MTLDTYIWWTTLTPKTWWTTLTIDHKHMVDSPDIKQMPEKHMVEKHMVENTGKNIMNNTHNKHMRRNTNNKNMLELQVTCT